MGGSGTMFRPRRDLLIHDDQEAPERAERLDDGDDDRIPN